MSDTGLGQRWRVVAAAVMAAAASGFLAVTVAPRTAQPAPAQAPCRATLAAWCHALTRARSGSADVLVVGDSITEGYLAPSRDQRWLDLVGTSLQRDTGGGGAEYFPASDGDPSSPLYPRVWTEAGGEPSGQGLGDRSYTIDPGGYAQAEVSAERLQLSYTAWPLGGAMSIYLDGAWAGRVDTYRPDRMISGRVWLSPVLTAGLHTIRVVTDPAGHLRRGPVVVEGVLAIGGATGVRVWDSGHSGFTSSDFVTSPNLADDVTQVQPDLLILELGTNDLTHRVPPTIFAANLRTLVETVRAHDAHPVSVLVVAVWRALSQRGAAYGRYVTVERDLAAQNGWALVDLSRTDARVYTADGVHPDRYGERLVGATVVQQIDPRAWPLPVQTTRRPPRPGRPRDLSTSPADGGGVTVTWLPPVDASAGYDFYDVTLADPRAGATWHTVTGSLSVHPPDWPPDGSYLVRVVAIDSSGAGRPAYARMGDENPIPTPS